MAAAVTTSGEAFIRAAKDIASPQALKTLVADKTFIYAIKRLSLGVGLPDTHLRAAGELARQYSDVSEPVFTTTRTIIANITNRTIRQALSDNPELFAKEVKAAVAALSSGGEG